ncbi:dynamin family protein [Campylobacter sp. RM9328]|uniref:dynamin family protein n=1 Tax=Campylobacter sp. RM9328 TaxID=1705720 RepID=UPI0014753513|nr:dynamin family protein [Campylobacter sp. RM9328]
MCEFLEQFWKHKLFLDKEKVIIADERILAVLVCADEENFDRFIALSEFRQILHSLGLRADVFSIQSAQIGIINALKNAKISKQKLLKNIKLIKDENIISNEKFIKLENFINNLSQELNFNHQTSESKHDFFHDKIEKLNEISKIITDLDKDGFFTQRAQNATQKIKELKFNVALTGVINSGKSSLLNALLGEKLLGTSNVPETVNLTILKHAKEPYANVNFWNEEELKQLEITPDNEHLNLVGSSKKIKKEELKNYTSAKTKISQTVKSVELYENLELLRDNICIIDTPGIDDAVFLREELVRRFMSECDLMVHLMNASQSTTQKDVEFIKNSLKNSHIVCLVVVLTHADLLSQKELSEVIEYTKKSMEKEGLRDVEFFSVSSKRYFEGKDDSGVSEFKEYLYETFFGEDNDKSKLSINAYKMELGAVADEFLRQCKTQLLTLNGSNLELNKNLNDIKEQKLALQNEIKNINETVKFELDKIDVDSLNSQFLLTLKGLANTIKDKVINENAYQKRQGKSDEKRINYIVQSALNDGILNAARLSRNEILRQITSCTDTLNLNFNDLNIKVDSKIFNIGEYLSKQNIVFDYVKICTDISKSLKQKDQSDVLSALDEFLKDKNIINFAKNLAIFEREKFQAQLDENLKTKQEKLSQNEKILSLELKNLNKTSEEFNEKLNQTIKLEAELEGIMKRLKDA